MFREHSSSAAIRLLPQPHAFNASMADTSSGVRISILPDTTVGERPFLNSVILEPPLHKRGQFLMSTGGQFAVSPDNTIGLNQHDREFNDFARRLRIDSGQVWQPRTQAPEMRNVTPKLRIWPC